MRVLLHCCCGPCAATVADHFQCHGDEVTGWFFNPNLHPPEEARKRHQALVEAAEATGLSLLPAGEEMGLADFLGAVARGGRLRCRACYGLRLEAAAQKAAEHRFDAFSSTLLISPYQDLQAIREIGLALAARYRVAFRFADLRARYRESCERARLLELYRQSYCGCLFSHLERSARRSLRAIGKAKAGLVAATA